MPNVQVGRHRLATKFNCNAIQRDSNRSCRRKQGIDVQVRKERPYSTLYPVFGMKVHRKRNNSFRDYRRIHHSNSHRAVGMKDRRKQNNSFQGGTGHTGGTVLRQGQQLWRRVEPWAHNKAPMLGQGELVCRQDQLRPLPRAEDVLRSHNR